MLNLDATDVLEAIASVTNVIKFTVSGHDATNGVISNQGLVTDGNTEIYTAVGATRIYSFTAYNSHSAAVTLTLNKDPANAGTLYPFFSVSLGVGYSLYFDGVRFQLFDATGGFVTGTNIDNTAYGVSWDGVIDKASSKNAIYDEMELKADLINPSFTTPDLGTPSAGNLGNCTELPTAGLATQVFAAGIGIGGAAADTGGIAFPATAVPSADPNTLDDYEEGTFNVTFAAGSGTITIDSTQDTMSYTKIGRLVSVQGLIRVSSVSTPSGALSILGLPFAVGDFSEFAERAACAFFVGNLTGTINMIQGIVAAGETTIYVSEFNGTTDVDMADHIQASTLLHISLVYYT